MRVADRLGGRTVGEWQEAMSATEFQRWQWFVHDDERRRRREDWAAALVAHQIYLLPYRIFGNKGGDKILEVDDFLLKFDDGAAASPPPKSESDRAADAAAQKAGWLAFMEAAKSPPKKPRPSSKPPKGAKGR